MRRILAALGVVLGALLLCAVAIVMRPLRLGANLRRTAAADKKYSIFVNGVPRNYLLHIPIESFANRPAALVLIFHGGGGHDWNMPGFTHFDTLADEEGFFVAYPDSVNGHWNDRRGESDADDVTFTRAVIKDAAYWHSIDLHRVYAAGISNGGFFANRLACEAAEEIAAIASVAATMPKPLDSTCKPSRPISVLYIQGTADSLVPINGGEVGLVRSHPRGENISLAASAKFWRDHDVTGATPAEENLPDQVDDGTHVRRQVWSGGADHTEVVVYTIEGGGHTWPGGPQYLPQLIVGKASQNLDATRTIWEFFEKHRLP